MISSNLTSPSLNTCPSTEPRRVVVTRVDAIILDRRPRQRDSPTQPSQNRLEMVFYDPRRRERMGGDRRARSGQHRRAAHHHRPRPPHLDRQSRSVQRSPGPHTLTRTTYDQLARAPRSLPRCRPIVSHVAPDWGPLPEKSSAPTRPTLSSSPATQPTSQHLVPRALVHPRGVHVGLDEARA